MFSTFLIRKVQPEADACRYPRLWIKLYDPEIASSELVEDGEVLFCAGNLSKTAIDNFVFHHVCNKFCKLVQLSELRLI